MLNILHQSRHAHYSQSVMKKYYYSIIGAVT